MASSNRYDRDWSELFIYDEKSKSCLIWKSNKRRNFIGKEVGGVHSKGYWYVHYKKQNYLIHRLVFRLVNGFIENDKVINHIDHNRMNNKISNLELVTVRTNTQRTILHTSDTLRKNNTSNITGLLYKKDRNGTLYISAQVNITSGKAKSKWFRYDYNECNSQASALYKALFWRNSEIDKLRKIGEGYPVC